MTDEQKKQVEELYHTHSNREIAKLIGVKIGAICDYARRQGWKKPNELSGCYTYSYQQRQLIAQHYADMSNKELMQLIGDSNSRRLIDYAARKGLRKSKELLANIKREMGLNMAMAAQKKVLENRDRTELILTITREYPHTKLTVNQYAESIGITSSQLKHFLNFYHIRKERESSEQKQAIKQEQKKQKQEAKEIKKMLHKEQLEEERRVKREQRQQRHIEERIEKMRTETPEFSSSIAGYSSAWKMSKPVSHEPCIKERCASYHYCKAERGFKCETCDSYHFLEFANEVHRQAWIDNLI